MLIDVGDVRAHPLFVANVDGDGVRVGRILEMEPSGTTGARAQLEYVTPRIRALAELADDIIMHKSAQLVGRACTHPVSHLIQALVVVQGHVAPADVDA